MNTTRSRHRADLPVDDSSAAFLEATRAIFRAEGLEGLSVRRVAEAAGGTTMHVYSRFGGKDGLIGAMYDEGFDGLAAAQEAVGVGPSAARRVLDLCVAYRHFAKHHPHHYALMFGPHKGGFVPSEDRRLRGRRTLENIVLAVTKTLPPDGDSETLAREIADRLFAFCHGWVTLEFNDLLSDAATDEAFERANSALLGLA